MRRSPWLASTIVFAALLLAIAVAASYYQLQYRFGYELSDEVLPGLILGTVLSAASGPCAVVGIGTLLALLAARLLRPPRPEITADDTPDDLAYLLERDPA